MKTGDIVVCRDSRSYAFTENKEYTVVNYLPPDCQETFIWPASVVVTDDYGRTVQCHANRFILKEPA